MFWLNLWSGTKSAAKKSWEAIKKLPHWAMVAFFTLIAVAYWLIQKYASSQRKLKVRTEQVQIEKKFAEAMEEASDKRESERAKIRADFESEKKKLEQVDKEIDEAAKKGPVGIANAWAEYLKGRKNEKSD